MLLCYYIFMDNHKNKDQVRVQEDTSTGSRTFSFLRAMPRVYAVNLGIQKGDFVRVYQTENQIIIEKA